MRRQRTPESHLLAAVMDYFAAMHILAFRRNTAVATFGEGKERHVRFGVPGEADIEAFPFGKVLWVECKIKTKQSEAQQGFQALVESHGLDYLLLHSVDELIAWVEARR